MDLVASEEPLQIVLEYGDEEARIERPLAITMRTPGDDIELVRGWLLTAGVIASVDDLLALRHCIRARPEGNTVRASLRPEVRVPAWVLRRRVEASSACGVCGADSVEALSEVGCTPFERMAPIPEDALDVAFRTLEETQTYFRHTGGTHAASWFDASGTMLALREDVGRHNAMDKLVGVMALRPEVQKASTFCVVSSRASFELVQKAVRVGVPTLAALGAPSSLAIELAQRYSVTLVGFLSNRRFNIYAGEERIPCRDRRPHNDEVGHTP